MTSRIDAKLLQFTFCLPYYGSLFIKILCFSKLSYDSRCFKTQITRFKNHLITSHVQSLHFIKMHTKGNMHIILRSKCKNRWRVVRVTTIKKFRTILYNLKKIQEFSKWRFISFFQCISCFYFIFSHRYNFNTVQCISKNVVTFLL